MLHTINKSPFERRLLDACLARAAKGSAIILIEDAVYAAVAGSAPAAQVAAAAADHPIFVLAPDLEARGLKDASLVPGVTAVDYRGFVDLAVTHGISAAWL